MRDHYHSHALLGEIEHHIQHLFDHLGIEGRSRLVKEHDLGLHGQSASDGHALLLPTRKLARIRLGLFGNAHSFEQIHSDLGGLLLTSPPNDALGQKDIVQRRKMREKVELLKDHADFRTHLADMFRFCKGYAIDDDRPRIGHFKVVDTAQKSGFARTTGADNHTYLPLRDVHRHVIQGDHLSMMKGLAQVLDLDNVRSKSLVYFCVHDLPPVQAGFLVLELALGFDKLYGARRE